MPSLCDPSVHREVDAYVGHLLCGIEDDDLMAFEEPDIEDGSHRLSRRGSPQIWGRPADF